MTTDMSVADELVWSGLDDELKAIIRRVVRNELTDEIEGERDEYRAELKASVEGRMNDLKADMRARLDRLRNLGLEIIHPRNNDEQATAQVYWSTFNAIADLVRGSR